MAQFAVVLAAVFLYYCGTLFLVQFAVGFAGACCYLAEYLALYLAAASVACLFHIGSHTQPRIVLVLTATPFGGSSPHTTHKLRGTLHKFLAAAVPRFAQLLGFGYGVVDNAFDLLLQRFEALAYGWDRQSKVGGQSGFALRLIVCTRNAPLFGAWRYIR